MMFTLPSIRTFGEWVKNNVGDFLASFFIRLWTVNQFQKVWKSIYDMREYSTGQLRMTMMIRKTSVEWRSGLHVLLVSANQKACALSAFPFHILTGIACAGGGISAD
jgi:hypothetical protein